MAGFQFPYQNYSDERAIFANFRLLQEFLNRLGGGGVEDASWVLAANNSSDADKARADQVCDGVDDQNTMMNAIGTHLPNGGTLGYLPGRYNFTGPITNTDGSGLYVTSLFSNGLRFRGSPSTIWQFETDPATVQQFILLGDTQSPSPYPRIIFDGILFDAGGFGNVDTCSSGVGAGSQALFTFTNCTFTRFRGSHVFWGERKFDMEVTTSVFQDCTPTISLCHVGGFTDGQVMIHNNTFGTCTGNVWSGAGFSTHGCFFENAIDGSALVFNGGEGPFWHNWVDHVHISGDHTGVTALDHSALTDLEADDHPQYRLTSADHSHQSAGLEGGTIAYLASTLVDAKGDLLAATAADTIARFAVGTDGESLIADSTAATGLKWAVAIPGGVGSLDDLSDVVAEPPTGGYGLFFNDDDSLWKVARSPEPLSSETPETLLFLENNSVAMSEPFFV